MNDTLSLQWLRHSKMESAAFKSNNQLDDELEATPPGVGWSTPPDRVPRALLHAIRSTGETDRAAGWIDERTLVHLMNWGLGLDALYSGSLLRRVLRSVDGAQQVSWARFNGAGERIGPAVFVNFTAADAAYRLGERLREAESRFLSRWTA